MKLSLEEGWIEIIPGTKGTLTKEHIRGIGVLENHWFWERCEDDRKDKGKGVYYEGDFIIVADKFFIKESQVIAYEN